MTTCKYDQFKAIAHPSQSRTNVMFCGCKLCTLTRQHPNLYKRSGNAIPPIAERQKALEWKPEPPKEETEDVTAG
jgi:hypothetical protein